MEIKKIKIKLKQNNKLIIFSDYKNKKKIH